MKRLLFFSAMLALTGAGCTSLPFTTQERAMCQYENASYEAGETFAAADGCNTCSCGDDGMVSCTKIACQAEGLPVITCQTDADCSAQNLDSSVCAQASWTCVNNACELSCAL